MFRQYFVFLAILAFALTISPVHAAETKKTTPTSASKSVKASAGPPRKSETTKAAAADMKIPDGPGLNILIRRTLLTINDANLSGNYSVLRDLAAPDFEIANSQAVLVGIFADLRNRSIDLAPILMYDPKLVRAPEIDPNGMLHVSGFVPTIPEQVNFDLLFQNVSGRWRMFGIALNTSRSPAVSSAVRPNTASQP